MTHYILIDSNTRQPVPLPFHTRDLSGYCVTVHDYHPEWEHGPAFVVCRDDRANRIKLRPDQVGLELITEADFMAERPVTRADKEA